MFLLFFEVTFSFRHHNATLISIILFNLILNYRKLFLFRSRADQKFIEREREKKMETFADACISRAFFMKHSHARDKTAGNRFCNIHCPRVATSPSP